MCTQPRQVENQRCSRTGRVQKNPKILKKNTIFNEHPVPTLCCGVQKIRKCSHENTGPTKLIILRSLRNCILDCTGSTARGAKAEGSNGEGKGGP